MARRESFEQQYLVRNNLPWLQNINCPKMVKLRWKTLVLGVSTRPRHSKANERLHLRGQPGSNLYDFNRQFAESSSSGHVRRSVAARGSGRNKKFVVVHPQWGKSTMSSAIVFTEQRLHESIQPWCLSRTEFEARCDQEFTLDAGASVALMSSSRRCWRWRVSAQ
jgi:hypothetical protein